MVWEGGGFFSCLFIFLLAFLLGFFCCCWLIVVVVVLWFLFLERTCCQEWFIYHEIFRVAVSHFYSLPICISHLTTHLDYESVGNRHCSDASWKRKMYWACSVNVFHATVSKQIRQDTWLNGTSVHCKANYDKLLVLITFNQKDEIVWCLNLGMQPKDTLTSPLHWEPIQN